MSDNRSIYTPKESFVGDIDGVPTTFVRNRDLVREGHELLTRYPTLFEPVPVQYDVEEATSEPGRKRAR